MISGNSETSKWFQEGTDTRPMNKRDFFTSNLFLSNLSTDKYYKLVVWYKLQLHSLQGPCIY